MQAGATHDADEIGVRRPDHTPVASLGPGETGYLIAGIKDVARGPLRRDGHRRGAARRRPRSRATAIRSRWCSAGSTRSTATSSPICATPLEKLGLNDASYTYEPETSGALGFGFRCGFLGLLHMEIIRERLVREFNLDLIATSPVGGLPRAQDRRRGRRGAQPGRPAPDGGDRPHRRADAHLHDPHAQGLHGHDHGPLPDAARRDEEARVPLARARWSSST